jgi:hypothetical protein
MKILSILFAIFAMLIFIAPAYGVEVIQREQTPQQTNSQAFSPLQGVVDFIGAWWFWLLILAILFVGGMWLLKWLNTQREKDNIFLRDYNRTRKLCNLQRNKKRIKERSFWLYVLVATIFISVLLFVIALVLDDVPSFMLAIGIFIFGFAVSIVFKITKLFAQYDVVEIIGKFGVKVVGYYLGECTTSDGYKNYLLWDSRKFLFWKNTFILKVNRNKELKIETYDNDTKKRIIKTYTLPTDLIIEGESVIAIKGEGVDQAGYFYYPILTDKEGNIVNMDMIAYARAREVALLDTLYQQTEDFAKVQREAINLNPQVRYFVKTKGESMSDMGSEGG